MMESINRFIPVGDVGESHQVIVDAPAAHVLDVAEHFDLDSVASVRFIFWLRAAVFGVPHEPLRGPFVALMRSLGWGTLATTEHREIVMGAVTQPWIGEVKFRAVAPEQFVGFKEPDLVKIAWTIQADPLTSGITRLCTQTRAEATDAAARTKFAKYWSRYSIGIRLIRRFLLKAIKREAERSYKRRTASVSTPATQTR